MNKPGIYSDRCVVVFDVETTGTDPEVDRIVQFAGVKLDEDLSVVDKLFRTIDPDFPIAPGATAVHGISNDDVKGAPKFREVAPVIMVFLNGCDLAGHNAIAYDIPLLMKEFERIDVKLELEGRRLMDTLQVFRHFVPHTLEYALFHYCGEKLEGAHDALCDTEATAKILKAQLSAHSMNVDACAKLSMGKRVTLDGKLAENDDGEIIITFGKHKGRTLKELARNDRGFLLWIMKKSFSEHVKDYVQLALKGEL